MIWVAALEAFALIVLVTSFAGLVRSMIRQQGRERDQLLDRIMHLAGQTWQAPPSAPVWASPAEPDEPGRYVDSVSDMTEEY